MTRLQRIRDGRVVNSTGFGKAFARLCGSDDMLAFMPDFGFCDGGCLSLALAVQAWLGPDRAAIRFAGRPGHLDHAVVEIEIHGSPLYLDADGLGTWNDVAEKMRRLELRPGTELVDASIEDAAEQGITDDGRHAQLAAVLEYHLGTAVPSESWLDTAPWTPETSGGPAP